MSDHDPLCRDYGKLPRITFDGTPFPCDCDLIAKVGQREQEAARADERERLVLTYGGSVAMAAVRADERERCIREIEAVANEVFPSDSTEFFLHAEAARALNRRTREGMLRAAEVVRKGKRDV